MSGAHAVTVDRHEAMVLDVVVSTTVPGALGCGGSGTADTAEPSCWSLVAGTRMHLAVITADTRPYDELGSVTPPLLVLVRAAEGDAHLATYVADLDHLVATMRLPEPAAPTYTSSSSVMPFAIVLPAWATPVTPAVATSGRLVTWEVSCEVAVSSSAADCARPSRIFGATSPVENGPDPVGSLSDKPGVTIEGQFSVLPAGRRSAQVATFVATQDVPGALGCDAVGSCTDLAAGTTTRVADIAEQGKPPLIVWESWTTGAPGTDGLAAEFDAAVQSIRFGS